MTGPQGPLDQVRNEIMRVMGPEIEARFVQLTPIIARALNHNVPLDEVRIPPPAAKVPAKTAASRTAVQGIVALGLSTVLGFVADTIGGPDFDLLDGGDWKTLGYGAGVAGIMAVLAFGQRKIGR